MKDLHQYLQQFAPLKEEEFELLTKHLVSKSFKKGYILLSPGEVQKELYFIKSGLQMSYFETEEKAHVMAFTYAPGISAVPDSFSIQAPSSFYLSCLSDSQLEGISYERLQELFDKSQAIERLFRRMTELVLTGVIKRHIELHALTMEERYKAFCKRSPHLLQMAPHKYIASYLGIDPTNFSKLFNQVRI